MNKIFSNIISSHFPNITTTDAVKMVGIEFTYMDGSKESYDPFDKNNDFTETDDLYIIQMSYRYEIPKHTVKSYRIYQLCDDHGYELINGKCKKCEQDD